MSTMNRRGVSSDRSFVYWLAGFVVFAGVLLGLSGCVKPDKTPPANVLNLTATPGSQQMALAWENPTDADFAGVRVQRRTDTYPASASDGDTVYEGLNTAFTDTGLTNGQPYYYTVFSFDAVPNYASGTQATGIPTAPGASAAVLEGFDEAYGQLEGAMSPNLTQTERNDLAQALVGAERTYREGDPCGAAAGIGAFLGKAQDYRAGNAQPDSERLYNLGRMLRTLMANDIVNKADCPEVARIGVGASAVMDEGQSDATKLGAIVDFGEPKVLTKEQEGETFTKLEVPGADADMAAPGTPAVPSFRRLFAAPLDAEVSVTVNAEEAETIQMKLYPAQPQPMDAIGDPTDPQVFADPPFMKDETAYHTDAPFPADRVVIAEVGQYRDMRVFSMEVATGQYNPVSETMTLFKDTDVSVSFTGGSGAFLTEASLHPAENKEFMANSVFNGNLIFDHTKPPVFVPANMGEELMILAHPDFEEAAQRLADWKNEKGIVTQVFIVNDGAGSGPDTNEAIDDLIEYEYDHSSIRPAYVLLLGDADYIPTFYLAANEPDRVGSATIGTDWPYADYSSPAFDLVPDFGVGRITVDTLDEADAVVDKIINYESVPPNTAAFYSNATIAAQFQCCNQYVSQVGVDQRTFIWVSEWCRNVMTANGKTVQRIYRKTVDGGCNWCDPQVPAYTDDSTPRRYQDGTSLPNDIGPGSGFSWNGTTNDIINAFNAGRFLIIHRDHGSPGAWETPWFRWSNVYGDDNPPDTDIANGALLPVVFSVNCASGLFDGETGGGALGTGGNFDYLVERLIKKPDGGAIAVFGDTRNSPSTPNSVLLQGFFDAMWPNAISTFGQNTAFRRTGDILNHGKLYLLSQLNLIDDVSANTVGEEIHMWHVFGDPTLEVWTANPYTVTLPSQATGTWNGNTLRINYAVNNAIVTATQTNTLGGVVAFGRGKVQGGAVNLAMTGLPSAGKDTHVAFNLANAISKDAIIPDAVAPANVSGFTAVAHKDILMLNWTNPSSDFNGVRIQRKTGSYPTSPSDGATVFNGSGTSHYDGPLSTGTKYYYTAFAYDHTPNYASGAQANATTWADITAPASVTGFTAASAGAGQIQLNWNNPSDSDFTGTRIIRKQGGCTFSETDGAVVYDGTATSFTDSGLENGQQYYYGAYAHDNWPNYAFGACAHATTPSDVTAPANITGFTANPGDKQIALTWGNPSDSDFAGVKIQRKTGGYPSSSSDGTTAYNGTAQTFTDTGLTNGTAYFYRAYAYDAIPNYASGVNATATPADTTPPPNIYNFQAAPASCSVIGLTWQNPVGTDFTGVKILRKTGGYPSSSTDGLVVYNGGGNSAEDANGIAEQETYYYKAFAYDASQNYASGVQDTTVAQNCAPPEVTGFTATPGDQQAMLVWSNPSVADFVKVVIVRKLGSYPTSVSDGTVAYEGVDTAHLDTGLVNGQQYFYTAFAYDGKLYSTGAQATATPESSTDTTPPGNIAAFSAEPDACPTLLLSWRNPADADFAGVIIVRKSEGYPVSTTDGLVVYNGNGVSFVDNQDIEEKTPYFYTAFAYDEVPNYSSGAQVTATTNDCTPPGNVLEFFAAPGDAQATLTWINPAENDFAGVRIQRKTGSFPTAYNDGTTVYEGAGQSVVDTPLENNITYYYVAFVFDTAQLYSTGAQATATPVPPDTTPPGNVAQFTAVPEGCLELYLSWQNPGDADFAGVVVVRKADGYPETPADGVVVYTGSAENHADTLQLGESMTYNYTAFAFDSAQNYSSGAQASGTTADCTPPENVSSFLAVPGDGLITLSWQNPGDPDFAGVRVVRKAESYPTSMDDGVKVYDDIGERFVDQPLENTIPYFYVAYAYDGVPLFASGVQATATPHEMTPPPDILRFAASPGLGQISLSWVKPSSSDFAGVRIQRSTKGYPTSVDDGDTVFESSENPPFVDTGLTGGVPYYYKAFSYDAWQNYSAGVTATATPTRIIIGR